MNLFILQVIKITSSIMKENIHFTFTILLGAQQRALCVRVYVNVCVRMRVCVCVLARSRVREFESKKNNSNVVVFSFQRTTVTMDVGTATTTIAAGIVSPTNTTRLCRSHSPTTTAVSTRELCTAVAVPISASISMELVVSTARMTQVNTIWCPSL